MARYTINYLTGDTETVEADGVEYDVDARDYTFVVGREAVALAPVGCVRSVIRQADIEDAITRIRTITPTWDPVADLIEAALIGTQPPAERTAPDA